MDENVACLFPSPFFNPSVYFAMRLKRSLTVPDSSFSDFSSSGIIDLHQREVYKIFKDCHKEELFIDLSETSSPSLDFIPAPISKRNDESYCIPPLQKTPAILPSGQCIRSIPDPPVHKMRNRSPPRRTARGPRRFASVFETLRALFS